VSVEPTDRPAAEQVVRLKPGGRRALSVWRPLAAEIEQRWRERRGDAAIDELRGALSAFADAALPGYLPVVAYADGMRSDHVRGVAGARAGGLAALLSQVLLAFTLEYEQHTRLSLPMCADVIRVLDADGAPVRDMPRRSGVSKEAIASALGFLSRHDLATVTSAPGRRAKLASLTTAGLGVQREHARLVDAVEDGWRTKSASGVDRLRAAIVSGHDLAEGLTPHPDGWRARDPYRAQTEAMLADPAGTLAHQPMVLHRGGYPDGS
jgi:hypothetical protein